MGVAPVKDLFEIIPSFHSDADLSASISEHSSACKGAVQHKVEKFMLENGLQKSTLPKHVGSLTGYVVHTLQERSY